MQALSRGGRPAAPVGAGRPLCNVTPQTISHGNLALALQHQAQRQHVLASASRRKGYQDQDAKDSLDVDSLDEGDGRKLTKYADLLSSKNGKNVAAAAANGNGAAAASSQQAAPAGKTKTYTQQAPPPPSRAPATFPSFNDDFGFDDTWGTTPMPPSRDGGGGYGSGGGYMNGGGGGYGGYLNGGSGGGGGGYMNDSGYGGGYGSGGGFGGYSNGGGGYTGYGNSGGYINTGYGGYSNSRNNRSSRGNMRMHYDDYEDMDETDGEMPRVKVDSCMINGKPMKCNHGITLKEVFVLGAGPDRAPLGLMPTSRAQALADEAKEDLLLINPDASPPVARIIGWSKYKYELEKNAKEKKAKSTTTETKEVRLRPSTDSGDIAVKLKSCSKFLSKGDRVKLVMKFEGRELQFKEQGKEVLLSFISELASIAKVEGPLNFKTGTYTILLSPNK